MPNIAPVLMWFRNDLRLGDNRALAAAVASGAPVVPIFILDDVTPGPWKVGGASRWWLHMSLASLGADLERLGSPLILDRGDTRDVLPRLAKKVGATAIYFTRAYEPYAAALEKDLKAHFDGEGIAFKRYAGALLREPEDIRTKSGDVYKVYTPFWRALSAEFHVAAPKPAPKSIRPPKEAPKSIPLDGLGLLPKKPDWAGGLRKAWMPGEKGAHARLDAFLKSALKGYAEDRNRPDVEGTSRLSPHLHFGEISPAMCWFKAGQAAMKLAGADTGHETFLKELVWREFSYTLLVNWPDLPENPFRHEFSKFPWSPDRALLRAWQKGQTGYPIVDAGMRELWQTGYMHNRVRMIVASFLIKDLLIPWQEGEAWFWDTLVDADLASNAASWQWVAGCGADAAPYFRIFNPMTQGEKFDPNGDYVRRYVPEISKLPQAYLNAPWTAPKDVLAAAGVSLGTTYPHPIVDHSRARDKALAAFAMLKAEAK